MVADAPHTECDAEERVVVTSTSATLGRPPLGDRIVALAEVVLCSGFPTQLGLILALNVIGTVPTVDAGVLSLAYIVILSLLDTAILLLLIWALLRARDERPWTILVGVRKPWIEATLGLALVPVALLITAVAFTIMLRVAPGLHNITKNPLEALLQSPLAAVWFAVVAVVAGGLREEVQRAFILHRFEQYLGGAMVGLVVFSVAFGLGHLIQGQDAAIATGLLGAFWGIVYLRRRSIVAPVFCHALFNLTEVVIAYNAAG